MSVTSVGVDPTYNDTGVSSDSLETSSPSGLSSSNDDTVSYATDSSDSDDDSGSDGVDEPDDYLRTLWSAVTSQVALAFTSMVQSDMLGVTSIESLMNNWASASSSDRSSSDAGIEGVLEETSDVQAGSHDNRQWWLEHNETSMFSSLSQRSSDSIDLQSMSGGNLQLQQGTFPT